MRLAVLGTLLGSTLFLAQPAQADQPTRRTVAATDSNALRAPATPQGSRVHFGFNDLYVPSYFKAGATYDLIVHFHGVPNLQEENLEKSRVNAVVVSVNLGISSGNYSSMYQYPKQFETLLAETQKALEKTGRAPGARLGRICLSAWSAGFAAVGGILANRGMEDRIDAVLLADGLHAPYVGYKQIYSDSLVKYANFAKRAQRGDKLFAVTHSSIGTDGYASTTETVGTLLHMTDMEKRLVRSEGYNGMTSIYESHQNGFHVKGYEGTNEKAHIDHVKGMHETVLPYLRLRWR
jgi:hypothetical protein